MAVNTVLYLTLAIIKLLPKAYLSDWVDQRNRRSESRSIYPASVTIRDTDVGIEMAGAGAMEVPTNVTVATPGAEGSALLDEPRTNRFPTRPREPAARLTGVRSAQFLVTHSNYLVPVGPEDDLGRNTGLHARSGSPTVAARIPPAPARATNAGARRSSQALARLFAGDDVRASLSASAVIAVEGEPEQVLLRAFLNNSAIVGADATLDSLDYLVVDVHGQTRFGPYLDIFIGFDIPFVILANGPALRPGSRLDTDLGERAIFVPRLRSNESFNTRRPTCQRGGLFTLASTYGPPRGKATTCNGCRRVHAEAKPGEVEWWAHKHFRSAFHEAHASWSATGAPPTASIVRQVLESHPPRAGSPAAREMVQLYDGIQRSILAGGLHS